MEGFSIYFKLVSLETEIILLTLDLLTFEFFPNFLLDR